MAIVYVLIITAVLTAGGKALDYEDVAERLSALEKQLLMQARLNKAQDNKIYGLESLLMKFVQKAEPARKSRATSTDGQIAFTAYLSQDLDNVAANSPVIFDSVLINDGNGYDNTTGVFTAPMAGVYYFTYFVGQKDDNQVNTMLTVNHANYVDAVAEGIHTDHNDQGGNGAVVLLQAGDQVQVQHRHVGNHIEGAPGLRVTTFTGFLMYRKSPISIGNTIVG